MTQVDPKIYFGKHKGQTLSQVESDYLNWLAGQSETEFKGAIGGKPAPVAAKEELERRRLNKPLNRGMAVEGEGAISLDEEGKDDLTLKSTDKVQVCVKSMDDAVQLIFKEFLLKTTKDSGFSNWLKHVAKEAIKYGTKVPHELDDYVTYEYLKVKFTFSLRDKTLTRIKK